MPPDSTPPEQRNSSHDPSSPVESERRQLTVMFADLMASTRLIETLGAEDYSELLGIYHAACEEVVTKHGGVVAQYLGDGIVCYFGYPQAAENDGVRAVTAAIEFLEKLKSIDIIPDGIVLEARVGIATGPVIFAGVKQHFGDDAVGSCLNKASRLEVLAQTGSVLICEDTWKLVGDHFEVVGFGVRRLKGFEESHNAYRVLKKHTGLVRRLNVLRGRFGGALIGREKEMGTLLDKVAAAKDGTAQFTHVSGEAGLGKSKLVEMFYQHPDVRRCGTFTLYCTLEHSNTPLHPVKAYMGWIAGVSDADQPRSIHDKLQRLFVKVWQVEGEQLDMLLDLLSPLGSGREPDEKLTALMRRNQMFACLCETIFRFSSSLSTVIFIVEDLHWIDPTTAEFLQFLKTLDSNNKIFVLVTSRPGGDVDSDEVENTLKLPPLDDRECVELVGQRSKDARISRAIIDTILRKSEGVPLLIESYVDAALLAKQLGRPLDLDEIPVTMNGIIQEKLDTLNPISRRFAQTASAVGRTFDVNVVKRIVALDDAAMQIAIKELTDKNLIELDMSVPRDAHYTFSHALIGDAVYASMNRRPREKLHSAVVTHLLINMEKNHVGDEIIADQFRRANRMEDAAKRYLTVAMKELEAGNINEAFWHLDSGVSAVRKIPKGRKQDELMLQFRSVQAPTTMIMRGPGWSEFGHVVDHARALMERLGDTSNIAALMYNGGLHNWATGNYAAAHDNADEIDEVEKFSPSDGSYMAANTLRGLVFWHQGRNHEAKRHLTRTIERYNPALHREIYTSYLKEFGVFSRFYLSLTETVLGNTVLGASWAQEAIKVASMVERPHALGFAYLASFTTAMLRSDVTAADEFSKQGLEFSKNQGFPEFVALARFCQGWGACSRGDYSFGLDEMKQGTDMWAATGFYSWAPIFAGLQTPHLIDAGNLDDAEELLGRYEHRVDGVGEHQARSLLLIARAKLSLARGEEKVARLVVMRGKAIAKEQGAELWLSQLDQLSKIIR